MKTIYFYLGCFIIGSITAVITTPVGEFALTNPWFWVVDIPLLIIWSVIYFKGNKIKSCPKD